MIDKYKASDSSSEFVLVRNVLSGLRGPLSEEYSRGQLISEADVQAVVIQHLKVGLRTQGGDGWLVGSNYSLPPVNCQPDVLCYWKPSWKSGDWRDTAAGLIAVIEIKWAARPDEDIEKLRSIELQHSKLMTWMVYGGHFERSIHRDNAIEDDRRKLVIKRWESENPLMRGSTILECGSISSSKFQDRIDGLRRGYWDNDEK